MHVGRRSDAIARIVQVERDETIPSLWVEGPPMVRTLSMRVVQIVRHFPSSVWSGCSTGAPADVWSQEVHEIAKVWPQCGIERVMVWSQGGFK